MKLPKGSYNLAIHYKDVFWLTQIAEIVEKKSVEVNSSKTIAITIDKFPPPIWQTTGFVLLAITIIISVGLASVIILRRRRKERTLT
jgi:hypothetical protein